MTLSYRVNLEPDDNGTLLVTCPDLPEVTDIRRGRGRRFSSRPRRY